MQVEHDLKIIYVNSDTDFEAEIKKMQDEGWRNAPGFRPFAVFPVVRDQSTMAKPLAGMGGVVSAHIDPAKVFILRPGEKLKDEGGTLKVVAEE